MCRAVTVGFVLLLRGGPFERRGSLGYVGDGGLKLVGHIKGVPVHVTILVPERWVPENIPAYFNVAVRILWYGNTTRVTLSNQ